MCVRVEIIFVYSIAALISDLLINELYKLFDPKKFAVYAISSMVTLLLTIYLLKEEK